MHRLAWTCAFLLAAAWLLPLHVLPWMSWHNEFVALVAVLVACTLATLLQRRGRDAVSIPTLAFLPALLGAAATLQWATGRIVYLGSLLAILCFVLLCAAAAAAGRASAVSPGQGPTPSLNVLARCLLAAGVIQLAVVFAQTFWIWTGSDWVARTAYSTRGGGNVAQPNQAALLFLLAMAATVYLRQLRVFGGVVAGVLLVVLAAGLATTQSRSGVLALAVLIAWALWRRRSLPVPLAAGSAAALGLLAVLLFAAWPHVMDAYWHTDMEEVNLTTSGRGEMWRQLATAVLARPWTGWGVMQVAEAQNSVAHQYQAVMAATFAHNALLDLALWIGIPGMLLAVAMAMAWSWPRVRAAITPDDRFCVAIALPVAVQALTEFPYAYAYVLAPLFYVLGVLDARVAARSGLRVPRPVAVAVLVAWTTLSLWSAVEYLRIEEDFRVARFEALRVGKTPVAYEVPRTHLLTQLDALLRATRVTPAPNMRAEDIALLRDVAMLHPWGATNFRYATALALNGQMEEATRQLQVLRALQGQKTFDRLMQALDEMAVEHPVLKQLRQP